LLKNDCYILRAQIAALISKRESQLGELALYYEKHYYFMDS